MVSQPRQLNFSPYRPHHLPMARHHLQGLRDVSPEFDQIRAAATGSGLGRGQHDTLARQVGRQRCPLGLAPVADAEVPSISRKPNSRIDAAMSLICL